MQETAGVAEGSGECERGIDVAHGNKEHSGQREGVQRSLSGSLSGESLEKKQTWTKRKAQV